MLEFNLKYLYFSTPFVSTSFTLLSYKLSTDRAFPVGTQQSNCTANIANSHDVTIFPSQSNNQCNLIKKKFAIHLHSAIQIHNSRKPFAITTHVLFTAPTDYHWLKTPFDDRPKTTWKKNLGVQRHVCVSCEHMCVLSHSHRTSFLRRLKCLCHALFGTKWV